MMQVVSDMQAPAVAPFQVPNSVSPSAEAVRTTAVSELNAALQVGGQFRPAGELVTCPLPAPDNTTVSDGRWTEKRTLPTPLLPAPSVAKKAIFLIPSVLTAIAVDAELTVCIGSSFTWYVIDVTPEPPLSVAARLTLTGNLVMFPLASGGGEMLATISGGVVSMAI
jgi:hypothetical protein